MTIVSKYASFCTTCRQPITPGQRVNWMRGVKGVTHISNADCHAAKLIAAVQPVAQSAKPVVTSSNAPIADFLRAARERGLKFPKVSFVGPNSSELSLSL